MKQFMDQDFLLGTKTSKWLYHDVAEKLPIIDYHCHINPQEIAKDRKFDNIAQVWLEGDHYKWRLMRAAGITEDFITGDADGREKFRAFAKIMPQIIGNPVYHWSHLELQRGFGISEPLCEENADEIFDKCNEMLKGCSARQFMKKFHVRAIGTTDDPTDDLRWHKILAEDKTFDVQVLPTFRPDKAIAIDKETFVPYIKQLGEAAGRELTTTKDVVNALIERMNYFSQNGCKCADHGLDYCMYAVPDEDVVETAFTKVLKGESITKREADAYKTYVTIACAKRYAQLNWVMQIHFGCLRDNNKPMYERIGPDTGYDAVNIQSGTENVALLLNAFLENEGLPKVILYSLNPADNTALVTIMACFQGGGIAGRIQHGSAWWFNDNMSGIKQQLTDLACNGVLGQFVGMLTDSRSFLSYTRHEYFRRILCEVIGGWVENGYYPNNRKMLTTLVENICYHNTNKYFGFHC